MVKKIKIKIIGKLSIQKREIKKQNKKFYFYDRKLKAYHKKSKIEISKIKFVEISKRKEKRLRKKPLEIKPEEIFKPVKKCNFDYKKYYKGINHDGYVRNFNLQFFITDDTTDNEIREMINILKENIESSYNNLPCPQRMNYCKLHYIIQFSNNIDDIRMSSNTTKTTFSIKVLKNRIEEIFIDILKIAENYIEINIYKQEYVNYEFKSVLEKNKKDR